MPWTEKQQQVIDERDKTILVSAAAGSGKTATLVERISRKITDEAHPADISEFLVVTFTKAAAAQMKEKLRKKMEEAQEVHPESEHIARQNLLIQSADISTIDSFCYNLVREYFGVLGLDPAVGIGDPGMLAMLKQDVLSELFEEKYGQLQEEDAFARLLDLFGNGRSDKALRELVDRIYQRTESFPDPDAYLQRARQALEIRTADALNAAPWMREMIRILHRKAAAAKQLNRLCRQICEEPDGPEPYRTTLDSDADKLDRICRAEDYVSMQEALLTKWQALSRKKPKDGRDKTEEYAIKKETCQSLRNKYKDDLDMKKKKIFLQPIDDVLADIAVMRSYLLPLLALTEEFAKRFLEEKKKRKMLAFSDIEHMAHRLVCAGYDADGHAIPTEIGRTVSARYQEIYIDEYQDSNYLQEDILTAISGAGCGAYNMFMVGDVKQSIYRFRQARPEIFVNKYNRFRDEGNEIKIELNHNFRSRAVVLDTVNYFFYQLMGEDLGGITYDQGQALVPGRIYPAAPESVRTADTAEILIADAGDTGDLTEEEIRQYGSPDKDTLEGLLIANRIRELTDPDTGMQVYDDERQCYRPAEYRDIVILSRSLKGYGDKLYNALTSRGIPVYLEKSQGYFQATEIRVILSVLAVVDNRRQDIPLSAALLSPIGGLDESELAVMCAAVRKETEEPLCLYEICEYYAESSEDTALGKKVKAFLGLVERFQEKKLHLSVSDLIRELLAETGYYDYLSAMPAGEVRRANADMLLQKAVTFENGSYKGLFRFLRYVEKMKEAEQDEGEASVLSEHANVVRIMTIHKSKGLEYPIVFVAGMGRKFNRQESKNNVRIHPDYDLAAMAMYPDGRYKHNTMLRSIYGMLEEEEETAEYLRVLYVAMTRAKEKLILTAGLTGYADIEETYTYIQDLNEVLLPYNVRKNADSYLSWLVACMIRYEPYGARLHVDGKIQRTVFSSEQILAASAPAAAQQQIGLAEIERMALCEEAGDFYRRNRESFDYSYPYAQMTKLPAKLSVSEIKRMKADDLNRIQMSVSDSDSRFRETEESDTEHTEAATVPYMDKSDGKQTGKTSDAKSARLTGAERGTLVHLFMKQFPFESVKKDTDLRALIREQKEKMLQTGGMNEQEITVIREDKIMKFLQSDLGCRMIEAARAGALFRERAFTVGIPADRIYGNACEMPDSELLVVQGVIDAYFYEADRTVVMDYKTDAADAETLIGRYRAQLLTYAGVIEKLTGRQVTEKLIYSFYGDTIIRI